MNNITTYNLKNTLITIVISVFFVCFSFVGLSQQTITIKDAKGFSIAYVAVSVTCGESNTQLTSTFDGKVVLPTSCEDGKIKIKHIGYQTKWIDVKNVNEQSIVLYERDIKMNSLVVTGQYTPSSDQKSIHKVKVIDSKRIQAQGAVNLQELMEQEMNIRVSQDQFLGSSMSIQGLSGENVKILIDGVPVIGRLNGNVDLTQINLNNVERVEIVEGPLSVSYGTNALAGTINIITKKTQNKTTGQANVYYESIGQYNVDVNANTSINKVGLKFNAGRNFFQGYSELDSGRQHDWKPKEQLFGGVQASYAREKWDLSVSTDFFNEKLTSRGERRAPYYETAFDDYYYTQRLNNSFQFNYKTTNTSKINVIGGYNYYEREKRGFIKDLVALENTLLTGTGTQDTSVFDLVFSRGTFSSFKENSKINYQLGYDINVESTRGRRIEGRKKAIGDYAGFASLTYKPTDKISLKPGLRYSYNSNYQAPVIPSFNARVEITQHMSVRGSYGRGFRSPSLKELHFFFVDINHNIKGNESLKAETSDNLMLQMSYKRGIKRGVYNFDLSGFYNKVQNQISLALVDASSQLYTYTNFENFYSQGLNFKSGFRYKTYKTQMGFSYIGRYNLASETNSEINKFSYSPEFTTSFIYEVEEWKTSLSLFYKYSGKLLGYSSDEFGNISQFETSDYGMMDASIINLFWKNRLTTTVGVKNIFNVQDILSSTLVSGVHSGGGNSTPVSWGRTLFLKLTLTL